MATFGNSVTPSTTWLETGVNNLNQAYALFTMPSPGGTITAISVYVDGYGGNAIMCGCIWSYPGNVLLARDGGWTAGTGTGGLGGQDWHTHNLAATQGLPSSIFVSSGTQVWLGWYCQPQSPRQWSVAPNGTGGASGGSSWNTNTGTDPANLSGITAMSPNGVIGAYATYTPLAAPTISSITPDVAAPGTTGIIISGTSFLYTTSVTFGGVAASYTINSDSQITATVPTGISGVVTVTVTNAAGSANASFTAGQVFYGTGAAVSSIAAVWYGTGSGVSKVAGIWVPNGTGGVKRVW